MAKGWCVLKPKGRAMIGIPSGPSDAVYFNSNKLYGPVMLPHLFAGFKQIHSTLDYDQYSDVCQWCYQPLYIVEKVM